MYAKMHEENKDKLLAACDEELLGKDLDGFVVRKRFYGGKLVDAETLAKLLDGCTIANLVGERVINTAKKKNLICGHGILMISGVPHAQIIRML